MILRRLLCGSVGLLLSVSGTASVEDPSPEDYYHGHVAVRETGTYAADGMVYFHTRVPRASVGDENRWRRQALISTQKMINAWVGRHAPAYGQLPADMRELDALCNRMDGSREETSPVIHLSGRGFNSEDETAFAYGFAVKEANLLAEAAKGPPGKTPVAIRRRWRRICTQALAGQDPDRFVREIGCGSLKTVPPALLERAKMELKFIGGLSPESKAVRLLVSCVPLEVEREDPWIAGLTVIVDLKEGRLAARNSASRLLEALEETPGVPSLWCHLGTCLTEHKLYALAAMAYKNAFCLSDSGLLPALLNTVASNLVRVYDALGYTAAAKGYAQLAVGLN